MRFTKKQLLQAQEKAVTRKFATHYVLVGFCGILGAVVAFAGGVVAEHFADLYQLAYKLIMG